LLEIPVWMGLTPYHGGGVPAERVKLISNLALEMSLTPHYEGGVGKNGPHGEEGSTGQVTGGVRSSVLIVNRNVAHS